MPRPRLPALACMLLAFSACAAVPGPAVLSQSSPAPGMKRTLSPHEILASALARGEAARDAGDGEALQQAALIVRSMAARQEDEREDLDTVWLAEATRLGAKPAPAIPYRGRVLGSAFKHGKIDGGSSYAMQQMFLAGERAKISVVPERGAILTLTVVDKGGKKLCDKLVDQPHSTCDWLPVFTERYRIVVQNSGDSKAGFYLVVN